LKEEELRTLLKEMIIETEKEVVGELFSLKVS
jgi:hypothetical protein